MAFARTMETFWKAGAESDDCAAFVTLSAVMRSWTYCDTWTRISSPGEG